MLEFMATLAHLLTRNGNRVGAVFYNNTVEQLVPPRSGRAQVLRLINDMLKREPSSGGSMTDLTPLLESAINAIKRRSLVFLVSDFKRYAVHYSSLSLIREAGPGRSRWRRHLPFALFLLALASLVLALGRPVTTRSVTSSQSAIVLALDVSLSMCSSDIAPNRLTVAQESAEAFIRNQDKNTRIGLVTFAGFAELIVPPTADKEVLLQAVRGLTTAYRTAVGSAIVRSLDAIAEVNDAVAPVNVFMRPAEGTPDPVDDGTYQPEIIVLLTDGASNSGVYPLAAAQAAADRGVRVYTIGYGTPRGSVFRCTPEQLGGIEFGARFRRGGFRRGGFRGGFPPRTGRLHVAAGCHDDGRTVLPSRKRRGAARGLRRCPFSPCYGESEN